MTVRILEHPNFDAEAVGTDVRLRFTAPSSRFGPVQIILGRDATEQLIAYMSGALSEPLAEQSQGKP